MRWLFKLMAALWSLRKVQRYLSVCKADPRLFSQCYLFSARARLDMLSTLIKSVTRIQTSSVHKGDYDNDSCPLNFKLMGLKETTDNKNQN